ncbi:hypothetical protein IFM89_031046 [Coptis chinensis]|uniref:Uncharacterized protein n=1 Tax=Coptis chinensis TaxID=261450 RepID=A0A835LK09_9MAGN|nr:hypothetical protein IFM89_031046 [Coptis chinensis]
MAGRMGARYLGRTRRLYSKLVSEEEKATENIHIKDPKPKEKSTTSSGSSATDAKPSGAASSTSGVSTDKRKNYGLYAGVVLASGALGWYLRSIT